MSREILYAQREYVPRNKHPRAAERQKSREYVEALLSLWEQLETMRRGELLPEWEVDNKFFWDAVELGGEPFGEWAATHLAPKQYARVLGADLHTHFNQWAADHGHLTMGRNTFYRKLAHLGVISRSIDSAKYFLNITLGGQS